jgi:DNA-binding GntR family transcriptional regulator
MTTRSRSRSTAAAAEEPAPTGTDSAIYERMVSAILDHRLPPGTKLVEDRLASAFGVSRTLIRPVLVRLANEQVVTLTPHRGATIAQPSEQEAREVFEVRRLIESRLVERFVGRAIRDDIQLLTQCIRDEEAAREAGDMRRSIRLSGDFHLHIADRAGQQTMGRILREMVSRTSLILMTYSSSHLQARREATACGCEEHRALLAAIKLRDAREASRLMREHLDRLEAQLDFAPPTGQAPDLEHLFAPLA